MLQITLTKEEVQKFGKLYDYPGDDVELGKKLRIATERGNMTKNDLMAVARWKWRGGRTRQLVSENTAEEIREISTVSFAAKTERMRIGALLALRGVRWPMASVILHFAFPDKYPIFDVRAMNSVGSNTSYTFEKWIDYIKLCRKTATDFDVSLRVLDRALWEYDRERGGEGRSRRTVK
jgi:hypothetical protein